MNKKLRLIFAIISLSLIILFVISLYLPYFSYIHSSGLDSYEIDILGIVIFAPNDFIIIPTPRTVKLIDKMAMLIRNKEGEIHLLYDASALDKLRYKLIHSNDSESKLSFVVYSKNQYFSSITDIPFDLHNKIFYCSNKKLGIHKEGTLHNDDYVNAKDLNLFTL